jgi:hypothetical protein
MSFTIILLGTVIAGVLGVVVLLPVLNEGPRAPQPARRHGTPRQNQMLDTLSNEKRRVLRAIHDLDFDYDLGKLDDEAYEAQRVYLVRLGVAIMQRRDDLEAELAAQDEQIEAAVAALRARGQHEVA